MGKSHNPIIHLNPNWDYMRWMSHFVREINNQFKQLCLHLCGDIYAHLYVDAHAVCLCIVFFNKQLLFLCFFFHPVPLFCALAEVIPVLFNPTSLIPITFHLLHSAYCPTAPVSLFYRLHTPQPSGPGLLQHTSPQRAYNIDLNVQTAQ